MDTEIVELENTDVTRLEPSSLAIITKAEIDTQIATAHAFPRSLAAFQKRAKDMVGIDKETAESCIYKRPVGGGKYAEGESIRMAEIVAATYGNIRVAARIVEQTDRKVVCQGMAHDLESNYAATSECVETTVTRDGRPYSESQRNVVAKACLAKAYRDAVFKVCPKALCKTIKLKALEVINGGQTLEQRRDGVMKWVESLKIDPKRVFEALNIEGAADIGEEELITLTGLRTALKEKDTTLDEAFPPLARKVKTPNADKTEDKKEDNIFE